MLELLDPVTETAEHSDSDSFQLETHEVQRQLGWKYLDSVQAPAMTKLY